MNWSSMTSLPCFDAMRHVVVGDPQHEYTTLSQYYPGMQLVDGTVYFARLDDYLRSAPDDRHAAFILLTRDPAEMIDVRAGQNVGRFDDPTEFKQCFDGLVKEFEAVRHIEAGVRELMTMVSNNAGVQQEVEFISDLFGLPASLADESFNHIAVAGNFTNLHKALVEEAEKGSVAPDIQDDLRHAGTFRPIGIRRKTTTFDTGLVNRQGRTIYNNMILIYIGSVVVGSISLFTVGAALSRTRSQVMPAIASALSMEFQKSDYWLENKGAYYTHLLSSYIRSNRSVQLDENEARLRFKVAGYVLQRFKYIVHFHMSEESFTVREVQSIATRIRKELPNAIFFIDDGNITYLISSDEFIETQDLEAEIGTYVHDSVLNQTSVRIGISSAFTRMSDMKQYYDRALAAIEVGRMIARDKSIYDYNEYRNSYMFSHLSADVDYTMYLYPPLMGLIENDQAKGTRLAYTLYCYLLDPEHPAEVCKQLGIHKNTLYFRLNKAKEFMHHDYKLGRVATDCMLTFGLLRYHGMFDHLVVNPGERAAE